MTAGYGLAGHFIAGNSTKAQREASLNFFRWARLPPPLPIWEVFRLPACKSGVAKQTSEVTTGALPAPPTIFRIRSSTSQSNPLSAGRLRVQVPSDPPFYRSVAQSLERRAWDREGPGGLPPRWKSCCSDHFRNGVLE
jgi:hypothetical protein